MEENTKYNVPLPDSFESDILQQKADMDQEDDFSYMTFETKLSTQEKEVFDKVNSLGENVKKTLDEVKEKMNNFSLIRLQISEIKLDLDSTLNNILLEIESKYVKANAITNKLKKMQINIENVNERRRNILHLHGLFFVENIVMEGEELYQTLRLDANRIPFNLDEHQIKGKIEASCNTLIWENASPLPTLSHAQSIDVNNVKIHKLTTFEIPKGEKEIFIRGCAILNKKEVCFADRGNNRLVFMTKSGYHKIFTLPCQPADVTVIQGNKLAVSLMELNAVYIINTENMACERLSLKYGVSGITCYQDAIVLRTEEGYSFLTCKGKIRKKIKIVGTKMPYVTCAENRIYFAKWEKNEVHCLDFFGNQMWIYKNESKLSSPNGVSADKDGNVYVTGSRSNNVVVISSDGTKCKEILSKQDFPISIDLDKESKRLLVCSSNSNAVMYSLQ